MCEAIKVCDLYKFSEAIIIALNCNDNRKFHVINKILDLYQNRRRFTIFVRVIIIKILL